VSILFTTSQISSNDSDIANINSQLIPADDSSQGFLSYYNSVNLAGSIDVGTTGGTWGVSIRRISDVVTVTGFFDMGTSTGSFVSASILPTWARSSVTAYATETNWWSNAYPTQINRISINTAGTIAFQGIDITNGTALSFINGVLYRFSFSYVII